MNQRVEAVDAIRGFALFGILLVNMTLIQFGFFTSEKPTYLFGDLDKGANWFIQFFGTHNFISLFSFLFGLSIILLQKSIIAKGKKFFPTYIRRIIILLLLGYIHGTFVWEGDILFAYGIIGIFLMMFINRKPKTLLIWAIILLALITLMSYQTDPSTNTDDFAPYTEKEHKVHQTGSYMDHVNFRLTENPFDYMGIDGAFGLFFISVFAIIFMSPLFLLGMYVGKKGWLFEVSKHIPAVKKIWFATGLFSFTIKILAMFVKHPLLIMLQDGLTPVTMTFFYGSTIILLFHYKKATRLLTYMANMGKMSVSNYLAQSIIATTIFYAYGFGLYGKIGYFFGILLTIGIYTIQLFVSTYWLQKYRMGPVEYAWRLGTYLEKPRFKRDLDKAS
ncbi:MULTISPECIES: DUF418 domain-containing protein [Bacillus]|uniref:Uncharacterized protein n=2 Tax=Bacillus cereus group TaxID=86661 RepID=A0A9X5RLR9_BACTU|nr:MULTISPECIES: DUF418 domain-containing protein [Bacillus]WIV92624.1 DUF418 domain-containing protein [Bacillus bombysepticus]CGG54625.1 Predicted membrane protein [Streptococcus pneumoniae]AHX21016.1 hypothetical protein CY96_24445 [Bacillus bombysepticus str. Wang]EKS7874964.1 DUF418 domain-containing protein [Bacillus cereus]KAA1805111.1 hypothetical protein FXB61_003887 [Bacillus cereus]